MSGSSAPADSSAVAVIVFMLDPGGNCPASALPASAASFDETARISPVPGRTTTRCVGRCCPATAPSAAFCTAGTSGVCSGLPGSGATDSISWPWSPVSSSVLTTETVNPAVPASCSWKARCSPDSPSWSPAAYRGDPFVLALLDDLGGGRARPGPAARRRTGRSAPAAACRSGRPRRAGRRPAARIFSKSGRRRVMTGTNWPSGAASTSATISSAAMPVACRQRRRPARAGR